MKEVTFGTIVRIRALSGSIAVDRKIKSKLTDAKIYEVTFSRTSLLAGGMNLTSDDLTDLFNVQDYVQFKAEKSSRQNWEVTNITVVQAGPRLRLMELKGYVGHVGVSSHGRSFGFIRAEDASGKDPTDVHFYEDAFIIPCSASFNVSMVELLKGNRLPVVVKCIPHANISYKDRPLRAVSVRLLDLKPVEVKNMKFMSNDIVGGDRSVNAFITDPRDFVTGEPVSRQQQQKEQEARQQKQQQHKLAELYQKTSRSVGTQTDVDLFLEASWIFKLLIAELNAEEIGEVYGKCEELIHYISIRDAS